jgi:hypothetical protein
MSTAPIEHLESEASKQRERIHQTALELMSKVDETKQQYTATNILHRNFNRASVPVSILGFLFGFAFAGLFTRR